VKHIISAIALSATLVSAGVLSTVEQKKHEREQEERVQFELEQMRIRANNGWTREESSRKSRATYGGSISGTVVNTEGNPIYGYVYLYDEYGDSYGNESSNESAGYTFTNVAPGKYTIGESYNSDVWYGDVADAKNATFFTVGADEAVTLDPITQSASGSSNTEYDGTVVTGTILVNGTPAAYQSFSLKYIAANNDDDWSHSGWINTDELGTFSTELEYVVQGESYYCLFTGDSITPVWIGGEALNEDPATFVFDADTVNGVVATATSGGTISGKITSGLQMNSDAWLYAINSDGYEFGYSSVSVQQLSDTEVYGDSTFTITGLPSGDYYLVQERSNDYADGFYPNNGSFAEAELISVVAGETTNITMAVTLNGTAESDMAAVEFTVTDSDNTPVDNCDFYVRYADGSSEWVGSSNRGDGVYGVDLPVDKDYTLEIRPYNSGIYVGDANWSYTAGTLVAGAPSSETVVLPQTGRIAGLFPDVTIADEENFWSEVMVMASSASDTAYGDGGYPFSDKYSVTGIPAGEYSLSILPWFEAAGNLTQQPSGPSAGPITGTVTVENGVTAVHDIAEGTSPVSGMISGSFLNQGYDDDLILWAVSATGAVQCMGWAEDESYYLANDETELYKDLFSRNWTIYDQLTTSESETAPVGKSTAYSLPFLAAGDYYIAIGQFGNNDNATITWYGDEANSITIGEDDLEDTFESTNIPVPAGAKPVNVPADNSWVKDINFAGATPIRDMVLTNRGGISKLVTSGNRISMDYNFTASTATMNIYSLNGRRLMSRTIDASASAISWTPNLAAGSYLVEVVTGSDRLLVQPIILQ